MSQPHRTRRAALWTALLATGLLVAGGFPMRTQHLPFWAAVAFTYGALFWVLVGGFAPPDPDEPGPIVPAWNAPRVPALVLAAVLAVVAWTKTGGNVFRAAGVAAWLGAVAAWLWAWWPQPRQETAEPREARRGLARFAPLLLAGIVVCGIFFYFYKLASVPGNPTSDHSETLQDLMSLLKGDRPIFFPRNTGREPWKFYWLYVLVRVFGLPVKYLTLKIATACIGLLAIPAMFLLGSELGGTPLGLVSAALVAWGQWPVGMARIGIRIPYAVFPTALALWALLRYLRRGDRASVLWAGVWIGVGLYGYIPARAVPLLVPVAFALALRDRRWRGQRKRLVPDGLLIAGTAFVVFLPLFHYMTEQPQAFWMRALSRTGNLAHAGDSIRVFAANLGRMALAFHWRGDPGFVNAVTNEPFLEPVTGALFVAGVVLAGVLVLRGSPRWGLPLAGLLVLTLPSTFNLAFPLENPSINRSVAAIPVVFLLAALPLAYLASLCRRADAPARWVGFAGIAALLLFSLDRSYVAYFVRFDRHYHETVNHPMEIARTIQSYASRGIPLKNAYVLNREYWLVPPNIGFELGDPGWAWTHEVLPGLPPPALTARPLLFVFKTDDAGRLEALRRIYPGQQMRVLERDLPDRSYAVYVVR